MATKDQYDILKSVFDDEESRYEALNKRAELYFTAVSIILGSSFFAIDKLIQFASTSVFLMLLLGVVWGSLLVGVVLAMISLLVAGYAYIFEPRDVAKSLDSVPFNPRKLAEKWAAEDDVDPASLLDDARLFSEEAFFRARIRELTKATEENYDVNENRARWLRWAGIFLVVGLATTTVFLLGVLISSGKANDGEKESKKEKVSVTQTHIDGQGV